jgi:hypothetical protein
VFCVGFAGRSYGLLACWAAECAALFRPTSILAFVFPGYGLLLLEPGVTGEVRFVNRLFHLAA